MAKVIKRLQDIAKDLWGKEIIPIDESSSDDIKLLENLHHAMLETIHSIYEKPIVSKRVNEVGNKVEPYIKKSISALPGYTAEMPTDALGRKKVAGYPDILIKDEVGRYSYIECKTYNKKNLNFPLRSFYLSPSENSKVIHDARHLVISLEIEYIGENSYVAKGFKIVDMYGLKCSLKEEWNASNKDIYSQNILIDEEA